MMGGAKDKSLLARINDLSRKIDDVNIALASIIQYLEEIKDSTKNMKDLSSLITRIHSLVTRASQTSEEIRNELAGVSDSVVRRLDKISHEQREAIARVEAVKQEITKNINDNIRSLKKELENIRTELKNYIDESSSRILYMIKEASSIIADKLEKQEGVISLSKDMLLGIITSNIIDELRKKHVNRPLVITKISNYPLIIVEDENEILLILITDVLSEQLTGLLDNMASKISFYTGKKVKKTIITSTSYSTAITK